jgi:hypothetical protein
MFLQAWCDFIRFGGCRGGQRDANQTMLLCVGTWFPEESKNPRQRRLWGTWPVWMSVALSSRRLILLPRLLGLIAGRLPFREIGVGHIDQEVIRYAVGRGDVDVEQGRSVGARDRGGVFRDRDLQEVAADEHGLGRLPSRDHMRVVDAEVPPLHEERRFVSALGRITLPAQQ